jgi:hypothetical protein
MDLPAYGTRHPSATIFATELCARSTRFWNPDACRPNTMSQGATARIPREHDFAGDRWHGFRDRNDICHSRLTEANRVTKAGCRGASFRAAKPQNLRYHAPLDHDRDSANRAMQLIAGRHHFRAEAAVIRRSGTGPAKSRAGRVPSLPTFAIDPHRQPAIPDGGRSAKNI